MGEKGTSGIADGEKTDTAYGEEPEIREKINNTTIIWPSNPTTACNLKA